MSETLADQLFLGRQPILDRDQHLVAYELLFRNSSYNAAEVTDNLAATATVVANAFSELSLGDALGTCRAFINVDLEFLFNDIIELLPPQSVVLEILETVPPTEGVIARCRTLKDAGFMLALDDFVQFEPEYADLVDIVDIIKVDIQPLSDLALIQLVAQLKPCGKQLLAEKVDSRERMEQCLQLGFALFQGYYFAKPTILAGKKMSHSLLSLMKLFGLLLSDADTAELEKALKHTPDLIVNLLRMTNSVSAGCSRPITSLSQAIIVLGRRQLERWLQLLIFTSGKQSGTANPLLLMAATRARQMELLANELHPHDLASADDAFMVGVMSLMPALIGLPMDEIIAPLGLAANVRETLISGQSELGHMLKVTESCETGDAYQLKQNLQKLPGLGIKALNRAQTQALQWANNIG